jgi:hypothetical protein
MSLIAFGVRREVVQQGRFLITLGGIMLHSRALLVALLSLGWATAALADDHR